MAFPRHDLHYLQSFPTSLYQIKKYWIKKLKISNHTWRNVPMELYPFLHQLECYGPCFFNQTVKNDSFWSDVFKAYGIFFSKVKPNSTSQLLSEPVFYNKNMIIGNQMIKYTQWVDNGVYCIAHFIKENWRFRTLAEFNTKFGMTVDFLTFNSCTSSIKHYIKTSTILIGNNLANEVNISLSTIYSASKGTRLLQYFWKWQLYAKIVAWKWNGVKNWSKIFSEIQFSKKYTKLKI